MEHQEIIKILQAKAEKSFYWIGDNRIDVKRLLDDYYELENDSH